MTVRLDAHGKPADLFTVKLEKLTYGGAALGRLEDGRAVFVPFALPGETVRARVVEEKRGHVRAELVEVLEPAPERIPPKCKHFFTPLARSSGEGPGVRACGGCHHQNLSYANQLKAKTEILRDQLTRIGKIPDPPVQPMVPSPQEWNYRNHVQFHLTREGKLGFVAADDRSILPIAECHLPEAPLNELWPRLEFDPGLGLERVSLRLGADGETMLILESDETPELEADLSVVHLREGEAVVMAGEESLTVEVRGRPFRVSAASFFQVNTAMAEKMAEHLLTCLSLPPGATVLDVYCGVGLFSACLAPHAGRVIGIESSPSACEDFAVNLDEFENVELYEGAAEEILPALVTQIDNLRYAVVDPPRAGLDKRALDALLALGAAPSGQPRGPGRIAYVSCDPSTLARDARRLIDGGYRLTSVTPFDLFPQTYHIEAIAMFEKGQV
ncbi:MAG: 23S rRNA (uracil1939-C5)-methyltransferase [Anaerolineaceae bacterium]|nr:MAG: 23S rRNA (uracil1939-C5)-methyltransferase [Anaerolineaceae bacterium]